MQKESALCEICGDPMPEGETMFKYHGYSGPCPKPRIEVESMSEASTKPQFDEATVSRDAIEQMKLGVAIDSAYIRGARWQFNQASEELEAARAEIAELKEALEFRQKTGGLFSELMNSQVALVCQREKEIEILSEDHSVISTKFALLSEELQASQSRLAEAIKNKEEDEACIAKLERIIELQKSKLAAAMEMIGKLEATVSNAEDLAMNALGLCDTRKGFEIRTREIQSLCESTLNELAEWKGKL